MEFVRSAQFSTEKGNQIITVFKVTPTIKDFKLILSMKITFDIGAGEETIIIDEQNKIGKKIQILVFDNKIEKMNKQLYDLLKDSIQL